MAVRFSYEQVVEATGARIRTRGSRAAFDAVSTDSRALQPGALFVALKGERFDAHDFVPQVTGAAGVMVSRSVEAPPGVAVFEVPDTLAALGALARYHRRRFHVPVGAVTGSNGKTTTKDLVGAILSTRGPALKTHGNLNNEVGVPLTLFQLAPQHVAAVVELGMNHAGEIDRMARIAEPDAALITVVQPVHLENFDSIEGIADAKAELFEALGPKGTMVVNLDDERIVARARRVARPTVTFGRAATADVRLDAVSVEGQGGMVLTIVVGARAWTARVRLLGLHNALNATGAFALATALGYAPEACVAGLQAALGPTQRLQVTETAGGVTVLDDSYNANPSSMAAALGTAVELARGRRVVAVLGDMLEIAPIERAAHAELLALAAERAAVVALFGPRFKVALEHRPVPGEVRHFDDLDALNAWVKAQLRAGDVVVVKASRGMRLERAVAALTGVEGAH